MLHMLRPFNKLLGQTNSVTCMWVRSGTSRLLVLDGTEMRQGAAGRNEVRRIMLGSNAHGGFGGATLQDNKVAIVWPEPEAAAFRFRFLQVIPKSGAVLPMECANSASAAAMLAQLGGHHEGVESRWRTTNLSTGQKIELRPVPNKGLAKAWRVRFLSTPRTRSALAGLGGTHRIKFRGRTVEMTPVLVGNLFLFARICPSEVDAATSSKIADAGLRIARKEGFRPPSGYHPKVIPYMVQKVERPTIHAASYYHGELHRSMAGSAAMALASFVESRRVDAGRSHRSNWSIRHSSGRFDVRLGFTTVNGAHVPQWAEFKTPVQLLGWGVASVPWRRKDD